MPLEPARLWFEQHAMFNVPEYHAASCSRSSSEVQITHLDELPSKKPSVALLDVDKAERFINALNGALGDTPLKARPTGNVGFTNAEVPEIYEDLFTPNVEEVDGLKLDQWSELVNEYDCNLLTFTALLYAVKSAVWRMFGRNITIKPERYHPEHDASHPLGDSFERVDFVIKDTAANTLLCLVKGKNPNVLSTLKGLLNTTLFIVDMWDNSGAGRKVLNELVYYMLLYGKDRLIVTSFQEAYILEIHRTSTGCFLSYSSLISNNLDSTLFRAMLGMTLVELDDEIDFEPFGAEEVFLGLRQQRMSSVRNLPGLSFNLGPCPCPSPGSGSGSGSSRKRDASPASRKRTSARSKSSTSGTGQKNTASTSKRGTERSSGGTTVNVKDMNSADLIVVPRVTRSVSKTMISSECQEVVSKDDSVIHFFNFPLSKISRADLMEFERDPDAPFPSFPTSARIPRLTVVRKMKEGTAGIIYEAELHTPESSNRSMFAIKVIDASLQNLKQYRNCYEQLKNEYVSYYLLALGKSAGGLDSMIQKFTPACYGLYRPKDKSKDVFALIIEFAGSVTLDLRFACWSINKKSMVLQSILSLHSIGLYHGDPEERNVAYYSEHRRDDDETVEDSYKFFDFGNSHWHQCPGIQHCEELRLVLCDLFGLGPPPIDIRDFQDKIAHQYKLPFCNLETLMRRKCRVKQEPVVKRLDELGEVYRGLFGRK